MRLVLSQAHKASLTESPLTDANSYEKPDKHGLTYASACFGFRKCELLVAVFVWGFFTYSCECLAVGPNPGGAVPVLHSRIAAYLSLKSETVKEISFCGCWSPRRVVRRGAGSVTIPLGLTLTSLPTARGAPSALPAWTGSSCPLSTGTHPAAPCVPWPGRGPRSTWSLCTAPAATSAPCARCPPTLTCASPSARHPTVGAARGTPNTPGSLGRGPGLHKPSPGRGTPPDHCLFPFAG